MDDLYYKPYINTRYQTVCETPHFAYPREELLTNPIFPYYILDGGAHNFAREHFGAADSDTFLELTLSGKLFEDWTGENGFDWEYSFSQTNGTFLPKKYEWQIWLQRLYIILPIAQKYAVTKDKKYADAWLRIVSAWDIAHPYQAYDPSRHYITTDMVWRDMQVAWRTLSLIHSLYMLGAEKDAFSAEQWDHLYAFVELHAEHLYKEARQRLEVSLAQNHVLQIGTALIMAGSMFPEFQNAAEYVRVGREVVSMNLRGAIFPDGGSDEDSPSYSHFILRLYLEAYLLLEKNGHCGIPGLRESLDAQAIWMYQMSTRDGRTIPINDAYTMDAQRDLCYVAKLIPLPPMGEKKSVLFPQSRVAVLRNESMEVYLDAMPQTGGHQHTGRPQLLVYIDGEPVIVDSGCSNYDNWPLYNYVRSVEAHNVPQLPDTDASSYKAFPEILSFTTTSQGGTVEASMTIVRTNGVKTLWLRRVELDGNTLTVTDTLTDVAYDNCLHLHAVDIAMSEDRLCVSQLLPHGMVCISADVPLSISMHPAMDEHNALNYSSVLLAKNGERWVIRYQPKGI